MKLAGLVGPDGSTPREWRLAFWDRNTARQALRKALARLVRCLTLVVTTREEANVYCLFFLFCR